MEVDPDLHVGVSCPCDGLLHISICSLDVWRVGIIVGPEADRDAKCVDAGSCNLFDVSFREESVPVVL